MFSSRRSLFRTRRLAAWCVAAPILLSLGCDTKQESDTDSLTNGTSTSSSPSSDDASVSAVAPSSEAQTSSSPRSDTSDNGTSLPAVSDSAAETVVSQAASSDHTTGAGSETSATHDQSSADTNTSETSLSAGGTDSVGGDSGASTSDDSAQVSTATSEAVSSVSTSTSEPESQVTSDSELTSEMEFPGGTPLVMIMIDASSGVFSRLFYWGGSEGFAEFPDAWEATRAALSHLAGETSARFWPVLYRAERDGACPNLNGSEEEPLANNAALANWLPPSADAVGETKQEGPLADALEVALEKLTEYEHAGPKHLLLISDGPPGDSCTYFDAPDCNRDPVFGLVQNAYTAGIRTRMLNLGLDAGVEFAEDVSHAGNGEPVIALYQKVYCIAQEAVHRGEIASNDYDAMEDYIVNWRQHAKGEYLPDGEVYEQALSYTPTDAATLTEAMQSYVQWVTQTP